MMQIPAGSIIRTKQRPSAIITAYLAASLSADKIFLDIETKDEDYVGKATGKVIEVSNPFDASQKELMIEILRPEPTILNTFISGLVGVIGPTYLAKTYYLNVLSETQFKSEYYIAEKMQTVASVPTVGTGSNTGSNTGNKIEVKPDATKPGGVVVVTKEGTYVPTQDTLNSPPKWPTYVLMGVFAIAAAAIVYMAVRKPRQTYTPYR